MKKKVLLLATPLILLGVAFCLPAMRQYGEDVAFTFNGTAAKAYAYGDRHFSAPEVREYDINRAEYWYLRALKMDPNLLGANHQLARIAFLRGNFSKAISLINAEIALPKGPVTPSSYYIRGLIEGYMGRYDDSSKDYEHYLESDPHNWAALNDLAWVLLKAQRFSEAADATKKGLAYFPENPWLLNSSATALYELGRYAEALAQVTKAQAAVAGLTQQQWLTSYPGNDPQIADRGVEAFKKAVEDNMHTIQMKVASSAIQ